MTGDQTRLDTLLFFIVNKQFLLSLSTDKIICEGVEFEWQTTELK